MDVKQKVYQIIEEQLGCSKEDLKDESTLEFLCADDLDIVEICMSIEEELQIIIPEETFGLDSKDKTLKEVYDIVQKIVDTTSPTWTTYNGMIVKSDTIYVCKNNVEFNGMKFQKGCRFEVINDRTRKCSITAKLLTPALSSTLTDHVGLQLGTFGRYLEEGKIAEETNG